MSLEADLLLDRRRLKRRLNFWRILAVVAFTAAVLAAVAPQSLRGVHAHVARVNVSGIITEDAKLIDAIQALAKDDSVAGVILNVDSPGGSVAGGESIRAALIRVAAAKPLVTVMHGTAASAGYMIALPAARIFARDATVTGSIGVILETGEASSLLSKVGITAEAITSGPLKDQPSYTRPLTPAGREYLHGLVDDLFDQFVKMVADARHMDPAKVRELADGRAYTGRQALALGLVDQIGGEIEARQWLTDTRGVARGLPIETMELGSPYSRMLGATLSGAATALTDLMMANGYLPPGAWSFWQAGRGPG